jgi:hypothetical protein
MAYFIWVLLCIAIGLIGFDFHQANPILPFFAKPLQRVVHPTGFSIMAPGNWKVAISTGDENKIVVQPDGHGRYQPSIAVSQTMQDHTLDDWDTFAFQGKTAYVHMIESKMYSVFILFQRNKQWYQIQIAIPLELKDNQSELGLPEKYWQHLNSFESASANNQLPAPID